MRAYLITCFCFFISFTSFAVSFRWLDITDRRFYRIDTKSQILEVEINPEKWQIVGRVQFINLEEKDIAPNMLFICLQANQKDLRYLLANCTQQVYRFDINKLVLERIDKTYFRGYNCGSTNFIRNNIIYSCGGYGMFRTNNLMTHFQYDTKEWIALNPKNNAPKSIHLGLEGYCKEKDVFFSGLNFFYSDSEIESKPYDYGFYEYNFNSKLWKKLGVLEENIFGVIVSRDINKNFYWNEKYFIIHYFIAPYSIILIIDPLKNEVYRWEDKEKIFDTNIANSQMDFAKEYVIGDSFYHRRIFYTQGILVKKVLSIERMKQNATFLGKLYVSESQNVLFYSLAILALLCAVVFGGIYIKKKAYANKSSFTELNETEKSLFEALVANSQDGGLTAEQINDILGISNKSFENQRKLRSDFIKSIEIKLRQIYQIDNPIERIPSKLDRRMIGYVLNDKILERVKGS